MNIIIAYGIIAVISLILIFGYYKMIKNRDIWFVLMFFSVFIVNSGYLLLSVSGNINEALLANRISYLGSVFLPLCMFMIIMNVCRVNYPKWLTYIFIIISVAVFVVAASQGYTNWYYSDVSIAFYNGAARLVKVYGPLHSVYYVYLFSYLILMAVIIIVSAIKKRLFQTKHAMFLLCVVFGNIMIWLIEQGLDMEFEFLSISYIITELLMLALYGMLQDFEQNMGGTLHSTVELDNMGNIDIKLLSEKFPVINELTHREMEVLELVLEDRLKRKEMAETLSVTEHTVKKHIAHIFAKLEVSDRKELKEKFGIR